jgi:hypothetical protein
MSGQGESHPDSQRIERVEGAVVVYTPCHGRQVFFPPSEATAEAVLHPVCPADGVEWRLELVADEAVEGGVRPVWSIPQ